jgi:hypothetical protein
MIWYTNTEGLAVWRKQGKKWHLERWLTKEFKCKQECGKRMKVVLTTINHPAAEDTVV